MSQNENSKVILGRIGGGEPYVATITLNAPEKLNSVDTEMLSEIGQALDSFAADSRVAAVLLQSSSEKAFCAGGDVKSLVLEGQRAGSFETVASQFFTTEYFVDHAIHLFPKPLICWAHGITMGGGLGLMNGCDFRVVTEESLLAMPEITIGLFPDVGASYFLNVFSHGLGLYLGLTGHRFKGTEALAYELADYMVPQNKKDNFLDFLEQAPWEARPKSNARIISDELSRVGSFQWDGEAPSYDHLADMSFKEISAELQFEVGFANGSPLSAEIIFKLLKWAQGKSLRECFEMEWVVAMNCSVTGDFQEGVRALLIDKDKEPQWKKSYKVDRFFQWEGKNLLAQKFTEVLD